MELDEDAITVSFEPRNLSIAYETVCNRFREENPGDSVPNVSVYPGMGSGFILRAV